MADARLKYVRQELADLHSRANFILDLVDRAEGEASAGDILEIPSLAALTVSTDGSATNSVQSSAPAVLTLNVNREPSIHVQVKKRDKLQIMGGAWAKELAKTGLTNLRNRMDSDFLKYLAGGIPSEALLSPSWDTAGTYHLNRTSTDSISRSDMLNAIAILTNQDGGFLQNLLLVVDAFAMGGIQNITEWQPAFQQAEAGFLGIPRVGFVCGVPVYQTNSVLKNQSAVTSATNIATNVCTATVPVGHGFVPGELIDTISMSVNAAGAVISSVTSTTVVYPLTGSNGSNGNGTITGRNARSVMMDRGFVHGALQAMPDTRIKTQTGTTTDELEIAAVLGFVARAGRMVVIHTPAGAI